MYQTADLEASREDWVRLPPSGDSNDDTSDIAYRSAQTGSVISLNSACRENLGASDTTLESFSNTLLLGMPTQGNPTKRHTQVDGVSALETTLNGTQGKTPVRIRATVVKWKDCIYDFMLISSVKNFKKDVSVYSDYIKKFRFNDKQ